MSPTLTVVLVLVAAAVAGALGFYLGGENRKRTAEAKIGSAEEEAKRIVNDAIKAAEQKRKETIIEAKDEAFKLKADADKLAEFFLREVAGVAIFAETTAEGLIIHLHHGSKPPFEMK